jgi:hypothetical protein
MRYTSAYAQAVALHDAEYGKGSGQAAAGGCLSKARSKKGAPQPGHYFIDAEDAASQAAGDDVVSKQRALQ